MQLAVSRLKKKNHTEKHLPLYLICSSCRAPCCSTLWMLKVIGTKGKQVHGEEILQGVKEILLPLAQEVPKT